MKKFLEGSQAVAEVVSLCKPGVIAAYPITPQTHIPEELSRMVAEGILSSQFVNVESEHSAASVVLGSTASGVRSYTASSSQGILLMSEVLFNIAGLRLPVVLTCANRAVSGPINIWNDQQDSISLRDSGWIQFYVENIQETVDFHIIAYRIAEDRRVMLPVMVCMDGYILTHGLEPVDMPTQEKIDKFLPPYKPLYKLDPENPLTLGFLGDSDYYTETRFAIQKTHQELLNLIPKIMLEFKNTFGRDYKDGLVERYYIEDAERVIVAMGSICGTIKEAVDDLRKKGKKVGLLKIITFRPFPSEQIYKALKDVAKVAVIDRAVSLGSLAPLYSEIRALFFGKKQAPKQISSFIAGLGGRDVTLDSIKGIFKKLSLNKEIKEEFLDLKPELLQEEL
ncbi:MAG: pyruvate ferredoxin oxidoreductase [Candidatus Omnitrophica bacterium]|nr:pyruvate ferredoxin oxidoreductase [Candidatus Omnitrophota bacterium]